MLPKTLKKDFFYVCLAPSAAAAEGRGGGVKLMGLLGRGDVVCVCVCWVGGRSVTR